MSKAWKLHEKRTAEALGGKRISRGANFGESMPDVMHESLSIECKYRAKLSRFLMDGLRQAEKYSDGKKIPVLCLKQRGMRGALVVMKIEDFKKILETKGGQNE